MQPFTLLVYERYSHTWDIGVASSAYRRPQGIPTPMWNISSLRGGDKKARSRFSVHHIGASEIFHSRFLIWLPLSKASMEGGPLLIPGLDVSRSYLSGCRMTFSVRCRTWRKQGHPSFVACLMEALAWLNLPWSDDIRCKILRKILNVPCLSCVWRRNAGLVSVKASGLDHVIKLFKLWLKQVIIGLLQRDAAVF